MSNGSFFGFSLTTERFTINDCDVDNRNLTLWCDAPRTWQTMFKGHGAYPAPGGVIVSAFVQGYPGNDINANFNITRLPSGARLTGGQTITVDLLRPDVLFLPYQTKVDLRVMRRFQVGNLRLAPVLDLFNLFNANTVTGVVSTYGSRWQNITSIMQARYIRLGAEVEW